MINKTKNISLIFSLALFVSGCSSVQVMNSVEQHIGQSVDYNTTVDANVGDTIFSQFDYSSRDGITTAQPFTQGAGLGRVRLPDGAFLAPYLIDNQKTYCTEENVYYDPLMGAISPACFRDINGNGAFEKMLVKPGPVFLNYDLEQDLPYKKTTLSSGSTGYIYELLYNGVSGNVINISYREFLDNFIRPAFQQDLQYTLATDGATQISFKGVKMEILSANNNQITYRVITGFRK